MGEEQKKPQSDFMSVIVAPRSLLDKAFWKKSSTFQFIYSMLGLVFGLACIFGGLILFFHGVVGSSSWTVKILELESKISDAAPGCILFIVGFLVVWITRFEIKIQK